MTTTTPPRATEQDGARRSRLGLRAVVLPVLLALVLCVVALRYVGDDPVPVKAKAAGRVAVDLSAPSVRPQLPAQARQPTEAGATRFVRYWFDALNYSLTHQDTDLLVHSTGAGCGQCSGYLIGLARWRASSTRLEGGLTVPLQLAIGPFSLAEPVPFAASFLTTPATLTAADGAVSSYPGGRTSGGLAVLWSHGQWQMSDLVIDGKAQARR